MPKIRSHDKENDSKRDQELLGTITKFESRQDMRAEDSNRQKREKSRCRPGDDHPPKLRDGEFVEGNPGQSPVVDGPTTDQDQKYSDPTFAF